MTIEGNGTGTSPLFEGVLYQDDDGTIGMMTLYCHEILNNF